MHAIRHLDFEEHPVDIYVDAVARAHARWKGKNLFGLISLSSMLISFLMRINPSSTALWTHNPINNHRWLTARVFEPARQE